MQSNTLEERCLADHHLEALITGSGISEEVIRSPVDIGPARTPRTSATSASTRGSDGRLASSSPCAGLTAKSSSTGSARTTPGPTPRRRAR
jgi:hypothetical protein